MKAHPDCAASALRELWRDEHYLAVDKPSGLAVHKGLCADSRTVVRAVRAWPSCKSASPMHRLDRGTSGVLLFALHTEAASRLAVGFEDGSVRKVYWALVRGVPPDSGVIDSPVPRSEGGPRVEARTEFSTLSTVAIEPRALSLVEARPLSGRFHQVRRHLKHLGHPIIGDANYGKGELNRKIAGCFGLNRLALHARSLLFVHPYSGAALRLAAPLPLDFAQPLFAMGFKMDILNETEICH
ncbi:MAG: RluA family pseudouridine synthase [Myxococcota bacterium]|jgi:tRNA pseudouridine65 synthase|nr:RluA family pseudouridine synthase [Myxococcota bacterium]